MTLALLLAATFGLGILGVGAVRPGFVLGCLAIGVLAWRSGPATHIEVAVVLFVLTPFLRRVVDSVAGYEPNGMMLIGPLLALLPPTVELYAWIKPGAVLPTKLVPQAVIAVCVGITALQTLAQGDIVSAGTGALKWLAPMSYGVWIFTQAKKDDSLLRALTGAFLLLMPLAGLYGVFQYINPPDWDRYWMVSSQMYTIGQPLPYQVRVFSTMNAPASFATFAACGLLLCGFCRQGWQAILMALPCLTGLLLSLYRTAWLELVVGICFCMLLPVSRWRGALIAVVFAASITLLGVVTPFGDVILDRLDTFSQGTQDGSAQERLAEYVTLFRGSDDSLFGVGFAPQSATAMPIDGLIVACWVMMGLPVGLICLLAVTWAGVQGMLQVRHAQERGHAVLGAVILGALIQIPLAGVTTGEMGFLFWSIVGIATAGTSVSERSHDHVPA